MRTLSFLLILTALAGAEERSRHAYDLTALTGEHADYPGPSLGYGGTEMTIYDGETGPWITGEDLREAVQQNIDPDSWHDSRNSIQFQNGMLIVTQSKENHDRIVQYLGVLRARLFRTVAVEADVMLLAPGVLDPKTGTLLTAEQVKAVDAAAADPARGRLLASLRAVATNRQRVHTTALSQTAYLKDFDIEIAQDRSIADPVMSLVNDGYVLDIRPVIAHDGATVFLETRFGSADASTIRTFESGSLGLGIIEQPDVALYQTRTTLMVPPGRTTLLTSSTFIRGPKQGWTTVVLIRTGVAADPLPEEPAGQEKRVLRAYDIAAITRSIVSFPGPELGELSEGEGEGGVSTGIGVLEEPADAGISIDDEALLELLQANVAPESWSNSLNRAWISAGQLFVLNSPEAQKAAVEFLNSLSAARARTISVEAWLVAMDEPSWRARQGALTGVEVPEADWTPMLTAAQKGENSRILGSVRAVGQNGTRFHAVRGAARSLVLDYDVEIAQGATGLDPVISEVLDGVSLDVEPSMVGDGKQVELVLRPSIVIAGEPTVFPMAGTGASVQAVTLTDFRLRTQTLVNDGQVTLVGTSVRVEGGKKEVLMFFVKAQVGAK